MALSSWFCANNNKSMFVKIVHPGGRVELHDRPMMAAEIMLQNPRCYVTYQNVFRQPWAVLSPDSVLFLGHKYFVVPLGTLRRLQRAHLNRSPSPSLSPLSPSTSPSPSPSPSSLGDAQSGPLYGSRPPPLGGVDDGSNSFCWLFSNRSSSKAPDSCLSKPNNERQDPRCRVDDLQEEESRCFTFLFAGTKASDRNSQELSSSETRELVKRGHVENGAKGVSTDHWQPSLEGINEEHPC